MRPVPAAMSSRLTLRLPRKPLDQTLDQPLVDVDVGRLLSAKGSKLLACVVAYITACSSATSQG